MSADVKSLVVAGLVGAGAVLGLQYVMRKPAVSDKRGAVTVVSPAGTASDVDAGGEGVVCSKAFAVVETDDLIITELFGGASTGTSQASIARVVIKRTCNEEWQRPEFDEWTVVLKGVIRIEREVGASLNVRAGEAVFLPKNELVRWVFPDPTSLPEYIAICAPAFSPDNCGRGEMPAQSRLPAYEREPLLFHAAPRDEWEAALKAGKPYYPKTYEADGGFVHATAKPEMLMGVLNHFYKSAKGDFVCLKMERSTLDKLGVRTCFEFPAPVGSTATFGPSHEYGSVLFPHIYSGIEGGMVSRTAPIVRGVDGTFVSADLA
jgi:uncharacterized protein (DUF952 family)/quercetin dioxygenase-like cupin family protein